MREIFIQNLARFFRFLPEFRGKTSIGCCLQSWLLQDNDWQNPEKFITLKDGSEVYMDARSEGLKPAYWTGLYDTKLIKKFVQQFEKNWIVLDIGANTGWYTFPFAKELESKSGIVHAFEPLNSNYLGLKAGIEKGKYTNIIVHKMALVHDLPNIKFIWQKKETLAMQLF
jgi:hypothetical protein